MGGCLSWVFWEDLRGDQESLSTTIRNLGLVVGGIIAMVLAVWCSTVAERQAETAQQQSDTAQRQVEAVQRQADTAQQGLLNDRYERGAGMLGSDVLPVRLAGIYALERLAVEHPEEYHIQIMDLLCAFVRNPTRDDRVEGHPESDDGLDEQQLTLRADVQDTMQAISSHIPTRVPSAQNRCVKLYLRDANMHHLQVEDARMAGAWLTNASLSSAILPRADLSNARLRRAKLSGAALRNANLSGAKLWGADLSGTILWNANLSGADLCGATARSLDYEEPVYSLTQNQLDTTCADPDNPPMLHGVLDAETGKHLVWRGKAYKGEE